MLKIVTILEDELRSIVKEVVTDVVKQHMTPGQIAMDVGTKVVTDAVAGAGGPVAKIADDVKQFICPVHNEVHPDHMICGG